jgi:hypothetical protein
MRHLAHARTVIGRPIEGGATATDHQRDDRAVSRRADGQRAPRATKSRDDVERATPSWTDLPDALLQHAATSSGGAVDALAGLRILDDEAARLVQELAVPPLEPADDYSEAVEAARRSFAECLDGPGQFAEIVRRADLDPIEAEVFALVCAIELDRRRQRLVAYVQDDVTKIRPTLQLVAAVGGAPAVQALAEDRALRRAALIVVGGDAPWSSLEVRVPPAVTWALVGDVSLDPALGPDAHVLAVPSDHPDRSPVPLAVIAGADRTRRLQTGVLVSESDLVLVLDAPADAAGWEAAVRFATLHGLGLIVEVGDELMPVGRHSIERATHLSWCIASRVELPVESLPDRPWQEPAVGPALATSEEVDAVSGGGLGSGHRLTADQLRQLDRLGAVVDGDLPAAIRRLSAGPLEQLARRVRPTRERHDLVLTPDQDAQLDELLSRFRGRDIVHGQWGLPAVPSAGVVALFSGPSGTGKTTAAEIVAGTLGLDLFVVNLASVVSKYIGETEKNLERIFEAAAAGDHVLLFDEADALFGRRTEVSDAHDRYANVEVAYLLQRLETFEGLLVLTTNLQRNVDAAFLRRIHVAIDFPLPPPEMRAKIWQRWLEVGAPIGDDVDTEFLAKRFELAGGAISNVVMAAAFVTAESGGTITMATLIRALRREFQKQGRLCTEADFGPYFGLVSGKTSR